MSSPNLTKVSDKLMELCDQYALKLPEFYVAELNYINRKAKLLMSQEITGLASQPLRDAECERLMSMTPEYEAYHKLKPEIDVITRQTWIYTEIAKNIRANQWEVGTNG